jgi:hypothetical protein
MIVLLERLNLQLQAQPESKTSMYIVDSKKCLPECQGCDSGPVPSDCPITPELILKQSYHTILTTPQDIQQQLQTAVAREWIAKFQ